MGSRARSCASVSSLPIGRPRSTFAPSLPGVDPTRIAIWGFSVSGGHVLRVAARNPELAAAIAQTPNADGQAAARNATRHQRPLASLRLIRRAVLDALGSLVGRQPLLIPLSGEPGTVALLTTPDAVDGGSALNPGNKYPDWQQEVAARSALRVCFYRPGHYASRVRCPLLVLVCDQDQSALAKPAVRAAKRASCGELVRMSGGHYEPFLGGHDQAAEAELSFLRRHLLDRSQQRFAPRVVLVVLGSGNWRCSACNDEKVRGTTSRS